ncbi:MAG: hypothetical protein JNM56_31360 [Planctomycetia bacterium]|nr:hypothetical protein [Planctomycetia bacterium]
MAKATASSLEALLRQGAWEKARRRIEQELRRQPDDHWLLTQLGVTYYEQGQYRAALAPLLESLRIVPDCPLTLWNIAGTLDALRKSELAIAIYSWLLGSKQTADDDPCWESAAWADSLKADCVYRLGACFQKLERWESAEHCFRQYINLILAGTNGTYAVEDAAHHIRELHGSMPTRHEKELHAAIEATLRDAGVRSVQGRRRQLPKLSLPELLAH